MIVFGNLHKVVNRFLAAAVVAVKQAVAGIGDNHAFTCLASGAVDCPVPNGFPVVGIGADAEFDAVDNGFVAAFKPPAQL